MMVRVDNDLAKLIKQSASAYRRAFKRRKSFATIANQAMRSAFFKRPPQKPVDGVYPSVDGMRDLVQSAVKTFKWDKDHPVADDKKP